jgi:hypothetical protein
MDIAQLTIVLIAIGLVALLYSSVGQTNRCSGNGPVMTQAGVVAWGAGPCSSVHPNHRLAADATNSASETPRKFSELEFSLGPRAGLGGFVFHFLQ